MNTPAIAVIRDVAACVLLGALSIPACASIARPTHSHGDMATAARSASGMTSSCARAFQGLGLRLDRDGSTGLRHVAEEREASVQTNECGPHRWLIPANDLTVMHGE